ncbi:MAG: hypothetical protein QG622_3140, partial [Actinomycetota bacterium]|nr:hypothetical protein [Actinomycetota bacterium]
DSELKAELFGDVKINFASETLPLDRFVDEAQRTLLERHSRHPARNLTPPTTAPTPTATPAPPVAPSPAAHTPGETGA